MHYHCEIIIPPNAEIEASVKTIMEPYYESSEADDKSAYPFWDFWVIGGRYAGSKFEQGLDKGKLDEFAEWCRSEGITVSGFQAGKQELQPKSQIPKVDAKWNEMFPSADGKQRACSLFNHSNDQFARNGLSICEGDISLLKDSKHVKCSRVIFAGSSFNCTTNEFTGELEAKFMLAEDIWNGCNHMPIAWNGTIADALAQYEKTLAGSKDSYKAAMQPNDDWKCITVDYHS